MPENDPTNTGGLFIGRRPGTAPLRYREPPPEPAEGRRLGLSTAAMCALGHEHENRVVWLWNESVA